MRRKKKRKEELLIFIVTSDIESGCVECARLIGPALAVINRTRHEQACLAVADVADEGVHVRSVLVGYIKWRVDFTMSITRALIFAGFGLNINREKKLNNIKNILKDKTE